MLFVVRTLSIYMYIILVSPETAIFKETRYCIPLYCVELLTVLSTKFSPPCACLQVYTSAQSTFFKPKVNTLKDTLEILTKTTYVQKEDYSSTSGQSTFLKLKVNVPTTFKYSPKRLTVCPKRSWKRVNSSLVMGSSFWILLVKYHHISIQLLS